MKHHRIGASLFVLLFISLGSAWAQIAVTDPATTRRNAVVAALKHQLVELVRSQNERLLGMARRLTAHTNIDKYVAREAPHGSVADSELAYGDSYRSALTHGDASGIAYGEVTRRRLGARDVLAELAPSARNALERSLATLDTADATIISGTHQVGALRVNGQRELSAIDSLETDVIDPSEAQGATAILDKISGAALIETRQKQARLHYLTAMVEQLVVDNKRARDTEAAALNMRLRQLQLAWDGEGRSFVSGASDDLRTWRQP